MTDQPNADDDGADGQSEKPSEEFDRVMGRDRLTAVVDGEEVEVFNHVSVLKSHYVNSVNGYESYTHEISRGDATGQGTPDAVTKRVADLLWAEFDIDADDHDIRVVDVTDEAVFVR